VVVVPVVAADELVATDERLGARVKMIADRRVVAASRKATS
jgi:hypothetical protein